MLQNLKELNKKAINLAERKRKELGMTKYQVASLIGITYEYYVNLTNGKMKPTNMVRYKMLEAGIIDDLQDNLKKCIA